MYIGPNLSVGFNLNITKIERPKLWNCKCGHQNP